MKKIVFNAIYILLISITALIFLLPVAATVILSFWNSESVNLNSYVDLLFDCFIFYPTFWNSIIYAVTITLLELVIIIPCAFGFVSARFKGKGVLFVFYIILMMMPLQVTILPNYIGLRDMGLIDNRLSIILPAIFSPFGVVVMNQYMQGINNSVIEAIRLETNSMFKILLHSVIPQIKVCVFAVALFVFADCWNMLEQPLLFLKSDELQNLSVFISKVNSYSGEILFSASVLFLIPVLLLYSFFNDSLNEGLTFGDLAK